MPQPIYLPQQPTFMDQFQKTGAMDNIMRMIMMGIQQRNMNENKIQGLQEQGYTEADPTAPTPQEAQAGYRGQAPGQYQGQLYDKSRQVGVAGRQFQRPPEPQTTFEIVKRRGEGGKDQYFAVTKKGRSN